MNKINITLKMTDNLILKLSIKYYQFLLKKTIES